MSKQNLIFYGFKPSIDNITFLDYPEPTGHAVTIYFTGCGMNCRNCQNPQLQRKGKVQDQLYYDEFVLLLKEVARRACTKKIVLMGGDPLDPQNREFTQYLLNDKGNEFSFCVYTGYSWLEAKGWTKGAKYVKAGNFREDLHQISEKTADHMQFASSNQELYKQFLGDEYMKISNNGRVNFND